MIESEKKDHDDKETYFVTSAIPYANAAPHIGHAYELVLADTLARYKRGCGVDTLFLTGTAEHGEKILRAAQKAGVSPKAFVDDNVAAFKDLYKKIGISNDLFIRNSDQKKHWPGAIKLWEKLLESKDIYKASYKGLYCVGCEKFITEKELVDGKCPDHDKAPESVEEENYFFRLSRYEDQVRELLENDTIKIRPAAHKRELLAFINEGLEDISFSRKEGAVPWGIPVPNDPDQMMYVWCEELSNYVSALGYGTKDEALYEKYWPADVHVIGKDILRFHAVIWPAMLIAAGIELPKSIFVHGHITSDGTKMSKTIGNVIDPNEYVDTYGSEAFRYYLIREVSPFSDGDFTKERFIETYNANLANGLGNLLSRTLTMAHKYFEGTLRRVTATDAPLVNKRSTVSGEVKIQGHTIQTQIRDVVVPAYTKAMEAGELQQASDQIWELIGMLDGYISEYQPFKLIKEDRDKTENILWNVVYGLKTISLLLGPIMPDTASKISGMIDSSEDEVFTVDVVSKPLFERIEEK